LYITGGASAPPFIFAIVGAGALDGPFVLVKDVWRGVEGAAPYNLYDTAFPNIGNFIPQNGCVMKKAIV